MKRLLLILLCLSFCLSGVACSEKKTEGIIMYKDVAVSEAMYSYWMSTYKSNFLYYYNDGIDSDEFWDKLISDTQTYEEYIVEWINEELKHRAVGLWLFDEYSLELPQSRINDIDSDIDEKIEYAGSREELNRSLAKFNMNIDMLRDVYIANAKFDVLYNYLYGTGGKNAPTDKDRAQYFADNYYCIKCITIYSGAMLKTDENGEYVYDDNGQIELVRLNDEQKAEKREIIDSIVEGLETGGDFDEYSKKFSEVDYSDYPNGIFVSENEYSRFGSDIINAAIELEAGQCKELSDDNVTYIVKKFDLPAYSSLSGTDKEQLEKMDEYVTRELYTRDFKDRVAEVKVNSEMMKKYSIKEISENSYF